VIQKNRENDVAPDSSHFNVKPNTSMVNVQNRQSTTHDKLEPMVANADKETMNFRVCSVLAQFI
jgi:hypothetical protein